MWNRFSENKKNEIGQLYPKRYVRLQLNQQIENDFSLWKSGTLDSKIVIDQFRALAKTHPNRYVLFSLGPETSLCYPTLERTKEIRGRISAVYKQLMVTCSKEETGHVLIHLGDDYPIECQHLPVLTLAKPENAEGILVPDDSFIRHQGEDRLASWAEDRVNIQENQITPMLKIPKLFFHGATSHPIRQRLVHQLQGHTIRVTNDRIPLHDFGQYRYLLDLPGRAPWSYRFKYLFLMNSLVFKVDAPHRWVNFYTRILQPDEDYIAFTQGQQLASELEEAVTFFEKMPELRKQITWQGYFKMRALTPELVEEYWRQVMSRYLALFKKSTSKALSK